jgi:hypothetical protein
MRTQKSATLLLLFSMVTVCALASPQAQLTPAKVDLPKGNEAWVIRVIRSGGLTAETTLDVELTSSGSVRCRALATAKGECPKSFEESTMKTLAELVSSKIPESAPKHVGCLHCVMTEVTGQYRDAKGKVRKYFAFWSDPTAQGIAKELVQIANTVVSATK